MKLLILIIPGLAISCTIFLLLIGLAQGCLYLKTGFRRSRAIGLFCLTGAVFSFEQFVFHSRLFPPEFLMGFLFFSSMALTLSNTFYIEALSYYIAIPDKLYRGYRGSMLFATGVMAVMAVAHYGFSFHALFHPETTFEAKNFFMQSYVAPLGSVTNFTLGFFGFIGLANIIMPTFLFLFSWHRFRDKTLYAGLALTLFTAMAENFVLPFNIEYYVPLVFIANIFEAFRMSFLSLSEYIKKSKDKVVEDVTPKEAYQNSQLSEERIYELVTALNTAMEKEDLFLNPNLRLNDLGKAIRIPNYQVSQVINYGMKTNFADYINRQRIEFAQKQLADPTKRDLSILEIAYQSGFNSKSTFNTAFKKYINQTPSQFRNTRAQ